jgi:uncharacterized protein (TIGR00299 family) protein
MRIAYFDCFSGISGDMTLGAFLNAGLSLEKLSAGLAKLKINGYRLKRSAVTRGGISGTRFECLASDSAHSRSLAQILSIIDKSSLPARVKNTATYIFENIGAAEAKVHGLKKNSDIRLHELGSIDSIIDIVGTAIAIDELGIDEIYASSVNTGRGAVDSAHGRLPVPAPATIEILKGVPVSIAGSGYEFVTPTGAGILKTIAKGFGDAPAMKAERIGYGAGSRDTGTGLPNMLRIVIGEATALPFDKDSVCVIEANIDDMNPQGFEYLFERLFSDGALDAYLENIQMKKSRPAFKLSVICECRDRDRMAAIIFGETTTIGLRYHKTDRLKLERSAVNVNTSGGRVGVKVSKGPGGILTVSPEYEECARTARKSGIAFKRIYDEAKAAAKPQGRL